MSPEAIIAALGIPDGTVFSLSHDDIGSWVSSLNGFISKLGLGIHPSPPYFNNLIISADGASITADFQPRVELVLSSVTKKSKQTITCIGKGAATQKGTAEFFSKHSVSLGTSEVGYRLQIDGTIAKLYHGEEQVWIGQAKGAHGLDGTYELEF